MMSKRIRGRLVAIVVWLVSAPVQAEPIVFVSTQLQPIIEAQNMRDVILENFVGEVTFTPQQAGPLIEQLTSAATAGDLAIDLIAALPGQLAPLLAAGVLDNVDAVHAGLGDRKLIPALVAKGKLGTDHQVFVPWMQATYLMAANKKALDHLPEGATLDTLTYAQLTQWAASLQAATGAPKLGFPAGQGGLMARFLEGYLYPSYTGAMVGGFKSAAAKAMWSDFSTLWQHVTPDATTYAFMQAPLLSEEVWIAFDHVARLRDAFLQEPDQFVAFPAPAASAGRGFMPLLVGLGVAKGAPERAATVRLIDYLTRPQTQITTVQELGFYPALEMGLPENIQPGIRTIGDAMAAQANAADALPTTLPIGLGAKADAFDQIYLDAFRRIVLDGGDIAAVLASQARRLDALMAETGARCSPTDAPGDGPCAVQ